MRRRIPLRPLQADATRRDVIAALVNARLASVEGDSLVIAHESVADAWPRLDDWLDGDVEGARLIGALSAAAEVWDRDDRPDEDLYRGARLQAVQEWRTATTPDLTEVEVRFVDASSARARTELDEREARVAREARQNRRLRWAFGVAAGLLVVALVTGGFALVRGNEASAAAEDALIGSLTSRSVSLRATNRDLAALLSVEAYRRWPTDPRTRSALMSTMTAAGPFTDVVYIPDAEWRIGAWPIPGTDTVAVVRDYTHLEIHDAFTGVLLRSVAELPDPDFLYRPWVRVSADGTTIAVMQHVREREGLPGIDDTYDRDELIHFFDVDSAERVGDAVLVDEGGESLAISPDGSLATWATLGETIVVSRDTGAVHRIGETVPAIPIGENMPRAASTFTPDGTIVTSSADGAIRMIDPHAFTVDSLISASSSAGGNAIEASRDGLVATLGAGHLMVADLTDGVTIWERDVSAEHCSRLAVSSVRRLVICGDENGLIYRWNLDTGEPDGAAWDYQLGGAGDLALSDDESTLLLMSAITPGIGRVRLDGGGPAASPLGVPGSTVATRFNPAGSSVVLTPPRIGDPDVDPPHFEVWSIDGADPELRIPEDLIGWTGMPIWDVRWAGDASLFVWLVDPATDLPTMGLVDVSSGRLTQLDLPVNVWWVFTDPGGQVVYVALADLPETEEVESSEVRTYDAETWERLPVTFAVEGRVEALTTTPDRTRVLISTVLLGEPAYRTMLFDGDGVELAGGLDTAQTSTILSDGRQVIAAAQDLDLLSGESFSQVETLPANVGWAFTLSASTDGATLLSQGYSNRSLALVDLASGRQLGDSLDTNTDGGGSWIHPSGEGFITTTPRGVQWWTLDAKEQRDAACRLAGREPTPEEWATYFDELGDRHPLCADVLG